MGGARSVVGDKADALVGLQMSETTKPPTPFPFSPHPLRQTGVRAGEACEGPPSTRVGAGKVGGTRPHGWVAPNLPSEKIPSMHGCALNDICCLHLQLPFAPIPCHSLHVYRNVQALAHLASILAWMTTKTRISMHSS